MTLEELGVSDQTLEKLKLMGFSDVEEVVECFKQLLDGVIGNWNPTGLEALKETEGALHRLGLLNDDLFVKI